VAKNKFTDTEFGLSALSPAFALSQVASGDANLGDLGVMGLMNRFGGGGSKSDGTNLSEDEKQKLRTMLAQQGQPVPPGMKRGGMVKKATKSEPVKKMASGGAVKSSASNRGDGCATRGKTKGRMV
jgi:hypothetical protein